MSSILLIDDDQLLITTLTQLLSSHDHSVTAASTIEEAKRQLESRLFDLVITDLYMPDGSGNEVIKKVKATTHDTDVLVLTAHGSIDSAVEAIKLGATDYLTKPFKDDQLLLAVNRTLTHGKMKSELKHLKRAFADSFSSDNIIGNSPGIRKIVDVIRQIAPQDINVLIVGDSGTGKELVAKAVHSNSPRRDREFVAINCSAMPELLLESELFGHVKGAFTSAGSNKKGLFEEADGGTIFLDEVGDTSPSLQAKLLRVLQEGEIRPVGSNQNTKINVRVIAATNKSLESLVAQGRFREDLYYRLNVISIYVPPLTERREDIVPLALEFLKKYTKHFNKGDMTLTAAACERLMDHNWPGNVRELENTLKRAVALSISDVIDVDNLFLMTPNLHQKEAAPSSTDRTGNQSLQDIQRDHILHSLRENHWNYSLTANRLGIGRTTLWRKVKKYNLVKEHTG